jgi:hypothetical protein
MRYDDFYDIALYLNEINRDTFTPKEIACNAYIYYADFQWSKENNEVAYNIQELAKLLAEDGTEEAKDWLYEMAKELELFDMDYLDYLETDTDLIEMFIRE